jgi:hypothetical protein
MNGKTPSPQSLLFVCVLFVSMIYLSGCTSQPNENLNTQVDTTALYGTWKGSLQIPMLGNQSTESVSQITITSDLIEMVLEEDNRTLTMNYTYTATSDTLVLTPIFMNRNRGPGGQPFNGTFPFNETRPTGNETWPPNGTQPPGNGTWSPFQSNQSWPQNGTRPPESNTFHQIMTLFYVLDEDSMIVYFNNVPFVKT